MAGKQTQTADRLRHGLSFNIYLPFEEIYLKEELESVAKGEHRSVSETVIGILKEHVNSKAFTDRKKAATAGSNGKVK